MTTELVNPPESFHWRLAVPTINERRTLARAQLEWERRVITLYVVPFPGMGQQVKFRDAMTQLIPILPRAAYPCSSIHRSQPYVRLSAL